MTRNRLAALSVLAAALLLGLLLWLVLGGGPAAERGDGEEPDRPRPAREVPHEEAPATPAAVKAARPEPAGVPAAAPDAPAPAPSAPPAEASVPGLAVLEDGTPLAGVRFWYGQGPGGGKTPIGGESGIDGAFGLPPGRPASVQHPWATPVAAAGGTLENGVVTAAADAERLVLTFRDRPGTAHVRLVDASTGAPVTNVAGLRETWEIPGAVLVVNLESDPGLGGWIPVTEGRLPESVGVDPAMLRVDPGKVTLVLEMPGYEAARLPLAEVRGRREVRVAPVEADVRGVVEVALISSLLSQPPFALGPVSMEIRSLDPQPRKVPDDLLGLPREPGPFALYGLPDGAWEIRITTTGMNGQGEYRAVRSFEKHGAPVDLGRIPLLQAGTSAVEVRVLDSEGHPLPQATVAVVRAGEEGGGAAALDLDAEGRVTVGGLQTGVDYRVLVRGLPRPLEQAVRAEEMADGELSLPPVVEFRWPDRVVPCRITLVVDGKVVANPDGSTTIPATIQESPLPRDRGAWGADGTFSADLVPGTYRFSALATAKDGNGLALFKGEVTVPAGESFETRLEMKGP